MLACQLAAWAVGLSLLFSAVKGDVTVTSADGLSLGSVGSVLAGFSRQESVFAPIVEASPFVGCETPTTNYTGSIVVASRKPYCTYLEKVELAEAHGAVALVLVDWDDDNHVGLIGGSWFFSERIPTVLISESDGSWLLLQLNITKSPMAYVDYTGAHPFSPTAFKCHIVLWLVFNVIVFLASVLPLGKYVQQSRKRTSWKFSIYINVASFAAMRLVYLAVDPYFIYGSLHWDWKPLAKFLEHFPSTILVATFYILIFYWYKRCRKESKIGPPPKILQYTSDHFKKVALVVYPLVALLFLGAFTYEMPFWTSLVYDLLGVLVMSPCLWFVFFLRRVRRQVKSGKARKLTNFLLETFSIMLLSVVVLVLATFSPNLMGSWSTYFYMSVFRVCEILISETILISIH